MLLSDMLKSKLKSKLISLLMASLFILDSGMGNVDYSGFQVFETVGRLSEEQISFLNSLARKHVDLDFWTLPSVHRATKVMVSEERKEWFRDQMREQNIEIELIIDSLSSFMRELTPSDTRSSEHNWEEYSTLELIETYMEKLATQYEFVRTEVIGQSFENRDIVALIIDKAGEDKPNVFIDGTCHAREWISPAVITYQMKALLELEESGEGINYLDHFNFYFVPVLNPDGYVYTFTTERLWRKSRTTLYSESCPGVDLNRNFPMDFGGTHSFLRSGSSSDPCAFDFRGNASLSESEASALATFFQSLPQVPILSISYHSALDLYLYPYTYSTEEQPDNVIEQMDLCVAAVEALNAVDGQEFECIQGAEMYPFSGSTMDWFVDEGSRFSYTPELRDNGYGFLLPPEFIVPSGEENFAALKVFLDTIMEIVDAE